MTLRLRPASLVGKCSRYIVMDARKLVLSMTTWKEDRSSGFGNLSGVWNWGFALVAFPPIRSRSHEQCLYWLLLQASSRLETFMLFLYPSFKLEIGSRSDMYLWTLPLQLYSHGCRASPWRSPGQRFSLYSERLLWMAAILRPVFFGWLRTISALIVFIAFESWFSILASQPPVNCPQSLLLPPYVVGWTSNICERMKHHHLW